LNDDFTSHELGILASYRSPLIGRDETQTCHLLCSLDLGGMSGPHVLRFAIRSALGPRFIPQADLVMSIYTHAGVQGRVLGMVNQQLSQK